MGKMGTQLYEYANGLDSAPVRARLDAEPVKSVGNGTTFPQNLTTRIQVRSGIAVLADSVATRLRREGLYAGGIQVTVRDPTFHDRSRQKQLPASTFFCFFSLVILSVFCTFALLDRRNK